MLPKECSINNDLARISWASRRVMLIGPLGLRMDHDCSQIIYQNSDIKCCVSVWCDLALSQLTTFPSLVSSLTAKMLTYPWLQIMLLVSIKVLAFFVLFSIMKYFTEDHIIANKQCQLSLFVDKHAKIYWFYKDWHSGGVPFALGKKRTKVCRHSKDYHIKYKEKRKQQKSVRVG